MQHSIILDKGTAFMFIGVVAAFCAIVMLKNGIEKIIIGNTAHEKHARLKGTILIATAITLLAGGIATILENELIIDILAKQIKLLMAIS